jgi:ribosomal protein S18 acetylase RimI-like enzyme
MIIRMLTEANAQVYRDIRLRMLKEVPAAYTASYEEFSQRPLASTIERLRNENNQPDNFILGAFEGEQLLGTVGLWRETGAKTRHKASIWGMYVAAEARGRGIGKALLHEAIARARALPDLDCLHLGVVVTQKAARQLYMSSGFVVYGREPRAVKIGDEYLDEELMTLDLRRQAV